MLCYVVYVAGSATCDVYDKTEEDNLLARGKDLKQKHYSVHIHGIYILNLHCDDMLISRNREKHRNLQVLEKMQT